MLKKLGSIENPILIEDWWCEQGATLVIPQENSQIAGVITKHHRKDLKDLIKERGGEIRVVTSHIKEVLPENIIKTVNTYYKLGKPHKDMEILLLTK